MHFYKSLFATACEPGSYFDSTNGACDKCTPGTYSPDEGAVECTMCAAGKYSTAEGATECETCAAGMASTEGSDTCTDCEGGTYKAAGAAQCTACSPGLYFFSFYKSALTSTTLVLIISFISRVYPV